MNIEEHEAEWAKKRDAEDAQKADGMLKLLSFLMFVSFWIFAALVVNKLADIVGANGPGVALMHVLACGFSGIIAFAFYATRAGGGR